MHRPPLPESRSKNREARLYDRGFRNAALGPRASDRGYLGRLLNLKGIGSKGGGLSWMILSQRILSHLLNSTLIKLSDHKTKPDMPSRAVCRQAGARRNPVPVAIGFVTQV